MNYRQRFVTFTGDRDQDHPQEKEMQEGNTVVWGALQIAEERREVKGEGQREGYTQLDTEFQRIGRRDR